VARALVTVRTALPQDIPALLELAGAVHDQEGVQRRALPVIDEDRITIVMDRPDVQILLAEAPGSLRPQPQLVGVLVLRRGDLIPLTGSEAVHVEQLWVSPDHRRRGVARALLRCAASIGEQSGLGDVVCSVPPTGREAHRFLARLGFVPLVSHRVVPVATLLRRLATDTTPDGGRTRKRTTLDQVLARRRLEQRAGRQSRALV